MEPLRIHIYDDEASNVEKWAEALGTVPAVRKTFKIHRLSTDEFVEALSELDARRDQARKGPIHDGGAGALFDEADILVLDYDLITVVGRRDLTGEEVAYLARCYSRCGILVALNQGCRPDSNPFHLDLRQHPDSWADVNCSSSQLSNPGLWGPWKTGLRPWYWPTLPRAVRDFERCRDELRKGALDDQPVLAWVGLGTEHVGTALTPPLLKHIVPQDQTPETMTFRDLAKYRLRPKDREWTEAVPGIAAATVRAWLAQVVLPPQNILVDAPHMVSRFPSLLLKRSRVGWDRTADLWSETGAAVDEVAVSPARFEKPHWLSRPVWYWQRLTSLDLPEIRDPWGRRPSERVFCEDVSRFLPKHAARRYHSGLSPEFLNRWVVDPDTPEGRSILGETTVAYEPAWLLTV
jgi:hypothetical protein